MVKIDRGEVSVEGEIYNVGLNKSSGRSIGGVEAWIGHSESKFEMARERLDIFVSESWMIHARAN